MHATTTNRAALRSGPWAMSELAKDDSITNEMAPTCPVILLALDDHWPPTVAIVRGCAQSVLSVPVEWV